MVENEITNDQAKEILLNKEKEIKSKQDQENSKILHPDPENPNYKSLGKIESINVKSGNVPNIGWHILSVENLPSGGRFYADDTKIQIKSATDKEIRHFSTIEPEDPLDADDKLNYVLDNCSIIMMNNQKASYKDLLEIDRFFIILAIRDLTFVESENKLQMQMSCLNCGNVDSIEITRSRLHFFNLDSKLEKYYNRDKKCLTIVTKTLGTFDIYIPTLGVTNFIKNITKAKAQQGKYIDKFFLKFSAFLFPDWKKLTENSYKSAEEDTIGWNEKKISLMDGIVDALSKSIDANIVHNCKNCGGEVKQPLSFQGGFKSLFLHTDIIDTELV